MVCELNYILIKLFNERGRKKPLNLTKMTQILPHVANFEDICFGLWHH